MSADNRVLGCDRITPRNAASAQARIDLLDTGVHSLQTMKTLAELRRQTLVSLYHVGEERVSAGRWAVEDIEEGRAWGLLLESDVRVPCDSVGALFEEAGTSAVVHATED